MAGWCCIRGAVLRAARGVEGEGGDLGIGSLRAACVDGGGDGGGAGVEDEEVRGRRVSAAMFGGTAAVVGGGAEWIAGVGSIVEAIAGSAGAAASVAEVLGSFALVGPVVSVVALAAQVADAVGVARKEKDELVQMHVRLATGVREVCREVFAVLRGGLMEEGLVDGVFEMMERVFETVVEVERTLLLRGRLRRVRKAGDGTVEDLGERVNELSKIKWDLTLLKYVQLGQGMGGRRSDGCVRQVLEKKCFVASFDVPKLPDHFSFQALRDRWEVLRDALLGKAELSPRNASSTGLPGNNVAFSRPTVVTLAVVGVAGVGKSLTCKFIANHFAESKSEFIGGVYFLQASSAEELCEAIASACERSGGLAEAEAIRTGGAGVKAACQVARGWFGGRKILLIVDSSWLTVATNDEFLASNISGISGLTSSSSSSRSEVGKGPATNCDFSRSPLPKLDLHAFTPPSSQLTKADEEEWPALIGSICSQAGSAFLFATRFDRNAEFARHTIHLLCFDLSDPRDKASAVALFDSYIGNPDHDLYNQVQRDALLEFTRGLPLAIAAVSAYTRRERWDCWDVKNAIFDFDSPVVPKISTCLNLGLNDLDKHPERSKPNLQTHDSRIREKFGSRRPFTVLYSSLSVVRKSIPLHIIAIMWGEPLKVVLRILRLFQLYELASFAPCSWVDDRPGLKMLTMHSICSDHASLLASSMESSGETFLGEDISPSSFHRIILQRCCRELLGEELTALADWSKILPFGGAESSSDVDWYLKENLVKHFELAAQDELAVDNVFVLSLHSIKALLSSSRNNVEEVVAMVLRENRSLEAIFQDLANEGALTDEDRTKIQVLGLHVIERTTRQ